MDADGERAVRVGLECLVLGTDRVAFEFVWIEEVMLIVKRQGPETANGRQLPLFKGHRVAVCTIKTTASRIKVLIEILRLIRFVHEDV